LRLSSVGGITVVDDDELVARLMEMELVVVWFAAGRQFQNRKLWQHMKKEPYKNVTRSRK
jgi:hypothetical protein